MTKCPEMEGADEVKRNAQASRALLRARLLRACKQKSPKRSYHYVMTDELTAQSSIGCLKGRVAGDPEATLVDPSHRSPVRRFLKRPE